MNKRSRLFRSLLLLALTGLMYGCGGGGSTATVDSTSARTGSVVQGPVKGSTVFADNVTPGVGTRFSLDAGSEVVAALSDATGKYVLPTLPSYDFMLVSYGGKDQITNQDQILLLAPAGARNITPLTTLVTLDTTKQLQAKLEALLGGAAFDTRVDTGATPAALLLVKTIETAVKSLSDLVKGATIGTISQKQLNYIQAQALQSIALEFAATPTDDLRVPAKLAIVMQTAMNNALTAIANEPANSNIAITLTVSLAARAIVDNSVTSSATALYPQGTTIDMNTALSISTIQVESSLTDVSTAFAAAVIKAVSQASAANGIVVTTGTPDTYSPGPLSVVTTTIATIIRINTGTTGGSGAGPGVTF